MVWCGLVRSTGHLLLTPHYCCRSYIDNLLPTRQSPLRGHRKTQGALTLTTPRALSPSTQPTPLPSQLPLSSPQQSCTTSCRQPVSRLEWILGRTRAGSREPPSSNFSGTPGGDQHTASHGAATTQATNGCVGDRQQRYTKYLLRSIKRWKHQNYSRLTVNEGPTSSQLKAASFLPFQRRSRLTETATYPFSHSTAYLRVYMYIVELSSPPTLFMKTMLQGGPDTVENCRVSLSVRRFFLFHAYHSTCSVEHLSYDVDLFYTPTTSQVENILLAIVQELTC